MAVQYWICHEAKCLKAALFLLCNPLCMFLGGLGFYIYNTRLKVLTFCGGECFRYFRAGFRVLRDNFVAVLITLHTSS